jgi:hypothetical protein
MVNKIGFRPKRPESKAGDHRGPKLLTGKRME